VVGCSLLPVCQPFTNSLLAFLIKIDNRIASRDQDIPESEREKKEEASELKIDQQITADPLAPIIIPIQ